MESLAVRLKRGEPGAFEDMHRAYSGRIHRFVERLVGPRDAEDLTQEVFLRVLRAIPQYRESERFEAWLYTIANNLCLDAYRRRRPVVTLSDQAESPCASPESQAIRREQLQDLLEELRRLPLEQRQVFLLREEAGLSFKEISAMMEAPLGTVLTRMKYAMDRLRARLSKEVNRAL